jgi:hypothetical protein
MVHVHHRHVRLPPGQDGFRFAEISRRLNHEQAVIQRQLNEIDHNGTVVEQ